MADGRWQMAQWMAESTEVSVHSVGPTIGGGTKDTYINNGLIAGFVMFWGSLRTLYERRYLKFPRLYSIEKSYERYHTAKQTYENNFWTYSERPPKRPARLHESQSKIQKNLQICSRNQQKYQPIVMHKSSNFQKSYQKNFDLFSIRCSDKTPL